LKIFGQAFAQSVQPFGDFLSGMTGQILCTGVNFDAGNIPASVMALNERSAIFLLLPDRLVVEDRATNDSLRPGVVTINSR
jgi:hypothetical protein